MSTAEAVDTVLALNYSDQRRCRALVGLGAVWSGPFLLLNGEELCFVSGDTTMYPYPIWCDESQFEEEVRDFLLEQERRANLSW